MNYKGDQNLEKQLLDWESFYNFCRPHGALRGKTPYEILKQKLAIWYNTTVSASSEYHSAKSSYILEQSQSFLLLQIQFAFTWQIPALQLPLDLHLPSDARLRRVVDVLRAKPNNPNSLEDWAQIANASERTLARLFRNETGLSFRQWRQQAPLTAAMCALSVGESPTKAATLADFDSQPAFGAAFRKFFGITPGQVRGRTSTAKK